MKPMMPMPIVAIRIRSLGPAGFGGSTVGLSSATPSAASAVFARVDAAEAAAADLRNERRELCRGSCMKPSRLLVESIRCL